jgi:NAD(P)-dependent dehydrogenase (short-subunit alcohol dehydrogenase family)
MSSPPCARPEELLPRSQRLLVLALDMTRPASIAAALEASGSIDVLVNNAGIGPARSSEGAPAGHPAN